MSVSGPVITCMLSELDTMRMGSLSEPDVTCIVGDPDASDGCQRSAMRTSDRCTFPCLHLLGAAHE
eukprot:scaffold25753_cov21-Tisochrysis_lutea.AAC.4